MVCAGCLRRRSRGGWGEEVGGGSAQAGKLGTACDSDSDSQPSPATFSAQFVCPWRPAACGPSTQAQAFAWTVFCSVSVLDLLVGTRSSPARSLFARAQTQTSKCSLLRSGRTPKAWSRARFAVVHVCAKTSPGALSRRPRPLPQRHQHRARLRLPRRLYHGLWTHRTSSPRVPLCMRVALVSPTHLHGHYLPFPPTSLLTIPLCGCTRS